MNVATILKQKGGGVFTTTSDKSLLDIAKLLAQHGIGCIVIVGDDDKIAGIVSERDLMRAISQGGAEVLTEPVSDFMTKTVRTAGKADTINQLLSEMTTRQFRHMPVVERDRLIGLVSIGDLVKIHVADAEFESGAMRRYITPQPSLLFDQASQLRLAGGA
jgi:CBS domain-containing protein